jgi:hypothetical protein
MTSGSGDGKSSDASAVRLTSTRIVRCSPSPSRSIVHA